MLTVAFVRHGLTDWNLEGRMQGHTDIPLNVTGRQQAAALATRLQKECWDAVYASPLSRARETAEIIARRLDLPVETDERLLERGHGQIEGTTVPERIAQWGENWQNLELGIEHAEPLSLRGTSFFLSLMNQYPNANKRIIVVSHGGLIRFTLKKLVPQTEVIPVGNTSLTRLHCVDECWNCELFNCMEHLTEAFLLT